MTARKVKQYGRLAVGQLVHYSAAVLAPTNSAQPCGCMRDKTTGKIINPDNTIGLSVHGLVTDMLVTESGCTATITLPCGGQIHPHVNHYGQGVGSFKSLRVLREAPTQMEIAA